MKTFFRRKTFQFVNWVSRRFFSSRLSYSHVEAFIYNNSFKKLFNLIRCHWEVHRGTSIVKSRPYLMILEVTNICNLKCPFCLTGKGISGGRDSRHMTYEEAKNLIDQVSDYVYMLQLYTWGEPLLNKDLVKIVEYAKTKNVYVMLSTNATALNEVNVRKMISCGIDYITLAIDGTDQESYAKYRIGGNYERVLNNVKLLLDIRKQLSSTKPFVEWQFIVFRHNEDQVSDAELMAYDLGINKFTPLPAYVEDEEWMPVSDKYKTEMLNPERLRHCERPWTHLNIRSDLGIAPCCYEFFKEDDFGDAGEDTFDVIWNNAAFQASRRMIAQKTKGQELEESKLICRDCIETGVRPSYIDLKAEETASASVGGIQVQVVQTQDEN